MQIRSKIDPKGDRKQDASWDGVWMALGSILEVKLGPSWHQNRSKMASKSISKHGQKIDRNLAMQGHAGAREETQEIWLLAP